MTTQRKTPKKPGSAYLWLRTDDNAAVTVDWVVLAATLVILGAVVIGIYRDGVYNVASAISTNVAANAP